MSGPKISRERWAEAAAHYESGEKNAQQLTKELGVSIGSFNWNMLREGASPPNAKILPTQAPGPKVMQRGNHVVRRFDGEEDRLLVEMAVSGKNPSEIGRALKRAPNTIRGRLMTLARHDDRREAAE